MSGPWLDTDRVSRQLEELQRRMDELRTESAESPAIRLLSEALTDLGVTVEELRVAEEEIRQQADELQASHALIDAERRRYQELFEFAPDGYLVTDGLGVIREVNQAAARLINRKADHLLGKPLAVYVAPKSAIEFRHNMVKVGQGQAVLVWDTCLASFDRDPVDVECTVAPAREPLSGKLLELRWRLHDVTDRKRDEAELQRSREALRELSGRLEAVREEERTRMARAVHDELGAALTAIKMDVAQARQNLVRVTEGENTLPAALERTEAASKVIDETMQTVRRIALELRPAVLDDFGLVAALDWQLTEFQKRSGLEVGLSVAPGNNHLDPDTATAVFRVFQEILTNVMRHAGATHIDVRLHQVDDALVLEVHDNGRGISAEAVSSRASMGLLGIRERLRLRGGKVNIHGEPGRGTRVRVEVPLRPGPAPAPLMGRRSTDR
jgi:PAS domain S-box-containing protein